MATLGQAVMLSLESAWGDVTTGTETQGRTVLSWEEREDTTICGAVVNHEEQPAIRPADRERPLGWNEAGKSGLKPEVPAWIELVWSDMRPRSLRKQLEAEEARWRAEAGLGWTRWPGEGYDGIPRPFLLGFWYHVASSLANSAATQGVLHAHHRNHARSLEGHL